MSLTVLVFLIKYKYYLLGWVLPTVKVRGKLFSNKGGGDAFSTIAGFVRVQKGRFKGLTGKVIGEKKGKIIIQTFDKIIYVPSCYISIV